MMGYEESEDNPHVRRFEPGEDEGESSEGIEEEEEEGEIIEDDEEEVEDVGEEACEVINDDSGEEDDIKVIGERTIDDAEPGEIVEVANMKHHDVEQTPWTKRHGAAPSMNRNPLALEDEEEE